MVDAMLDLLTRSKFGLVHKCLGFYACPWTTACIHQRSIIHARRDPLDQMMPFHSSDDVMAPRRVGHGSQEHFACDFALLYLTPEFLRWAEKEIAIRANLWRPTLQHSKWQVGPWSAIDRGRVIDWGLQKLVLRKKLGPGIPAGNSARAVRELRRVRLSLCQLPAIGTRPDIRDPAIL